MLSPNKNLKVAVSLLFVSTLKRITATSDIKYLVLGDKKSVWPADSVKKKRTSAP